MTSASDADISDSFVDQLEQELDFGQIQAGDVDGGCILMASRKFRRTK